jgi:hypothetical protein
LGPQLLFSAPDLLSIDVAGPIAKFVLFGNTRISNIFNMKKLELSGTSKFKYVSFILWLD